MLKKILVTVFILIPSFIFVNAETFPSEENNSDHDRFLEVKNWVGTITLTIKEKLLLEKDIENGDYIIIDHTFTYKFVTNNGEITTFDPFLPMPDGRIDQSQEDEQQGQTDPAARKMKMAQDIMKNFDFNDPKGSLKKMNISFDSYKNWMAGVGYNDKDKSIVDYNLNDEYVYHFDTFGEGSKGCHITQSEKLKGTGRDQKISLLFSVNSAEGIYGFKFPFKPNDYTLYSTVTYSPQVCNGTGDRFENSEKQINNIPGIFGKMSEEPVVKKIPLPGNGLELSGSIILEKYYQVRNPKDDSMMEVDASVSWLIHPDN